MGRIENFLKMPWEYNFEFECGDEGYARLNTFERYFTFKTSREESGYKDAQKFINEHSDYIDIYDPDGSGNRYYPLTHTIYEKLWDWGRSNRTFGVCKDKFGGILFGGDTMNSVQTVLGWIAGKNQNGRYSVHWTLKRWYTDKTLEELWKEMGIMEYIDAYHTLGNFVLVPALFNGKRGLDSDINDFWDRSLKFLKENGYNKFTPDNFTEYINYFFLWDYVEVTKDNKSFIPKTDLSEGLCPVEYNEELKQNYTNFFKTSTSLINRRGKFMTAMLMIQTQNPALYKDEIQTFLINDEFRAKSIFDAANQILENQELEKKIPENAKILLDELKKGEV